MGVVVGGGKLGVACECLAQDYLRSRQKQIELARKGGETLAS